MTLIPYEDLSIRWISNLSKISLELPWIELEVEVDEHEKDWVNEALKEIQSDHTKPLAQRLLHKLDEYPLSYIAARPQSALRKTSTESSGDISVDLESPKTLAHSINPNLKELQTQLPATWHWSLKHILDISRIENTLLHDPVTLVTFLIGKRLAHESLTDQIRTDLPKNLDRLRDMDEPCFFEVMKTMIRQTHYITSYLQECVRPALSSFKAACQVVQQFMDEEKGHDRLMIDALKALGCEDFSGIEPFDSTVLVMDLLKRTSQECPLAFTLMIGHFEGSVIEESDPFADLLAKSSCPASAKGYAIHHEINKREQHNKMILKMAQYLGLQSEQEVKYAARALELATTLGARGNQMLYDMSHRNLV